MRVERLVHGERPASTLAGSVLTRDLVVGLDRWRKGRRLSPTDLERLLDGPDAIPDGGVSLLVLEEDDLHEDTAAALLAEAVRGPGLLPRGPAQSRIDLLAAAPGVVHVALTPLEAINRIDPLEVFTAFDGSIVAAGDLVASVKVAPHVVPAETVDAGVRIARAADPVVRVAPFVPLSVAAVARERGDLATRRRFEAGVASKVECLGSTLVSVAYAEDAAAIERELRRAVFTLAVDVIVTAGAASTDPVDPFFTSIERMGGRLVRRGVPAHPGSMLWLASVARTAILGLPTCGAFSVATAADLVLPRLLTGEPATPELVSGLGHGGILTRDQRFRFPAYARDLDAPDG